ncbi:GNAT family N-acetyltransferase [Chitinophaga sp. 30R24]|uniref:GNAT family N-acetyltransferase n=1 Tax=Chitinophaga sp. 30R24 TaxID=3248838 RepID=UPI003B921291
MESISTPSGEYTITSDKTRFDLHAIHHYLAHESYWSKDISLDIVAKMVKGAVCVGVFHGTAQVGFARAITDRATFAYLADVYILAPHRGKGLSKAMVRALLTHPELQGLRRWLLVTSDAHGLYSQFGFTAIPNPEKFMTLYNPDIYTKKTE